MPGKYTEKCCLFLFCKEGQISTMRKLDRIFVFVY